MVTLLTIQVVSILATTLTNLLGIVTFSTDYWSIIVYDLVHLRSYAKSIVIQNIETGQTEIFDINNKTENMTHYRPILIKTEDDVLLYNTRKGVFRQCNSLPLVVHLNFKIGQCRVLKTINNQYDDILHGMNNPGREFIRLHNVAASCGILVILLLCACTVVGITVGILNSVVLATMTVGVIYLVITMFVTFVIAIMYTISMSERKQSHCYSLEILSDHLCSSRTIQFSYSYLLGCCLIVACILTSVCWLSLQEKQRKFAQN